MEMVLECPNYKYTLAVIGLVSWAAGSNIWPSASKLYYPSLIFILIISLLFIKIFIDADSFIKYVDNFNAYLLLKNNFPI